MNKIIYILICSIFICGCSEDPIDPLRPAEIDKISQLPKYPEETIEIMATDHIPERVLNGGPNFKSDVNTRVGTIVRDSIWPNGFGISYFGVATESIIMENLQRYIYPGSLLQGNTVADANYAPVPATIKPITVSVSFPAKKVTGVLNNPSLSSTRQLVNDLVRQEGIGKQSASLSFQVDQFTSYEELKIAFGSNQKVSGIFFSNSSGQENFEHKISKGTGISVQFIQKYFSLDMDIPRNGLVEGDISGLVKYSPVYVSSITYGRMGIMTIETNESYLDASSKITQAFNTLFIKKQTTISESIKSLIENAVIKVFLIGTNGKTSVETIKGFEAFLKVITEGGEFNESNFGGPLYSSFSYLNDHSPFKINFKYHLDSPPIYARLEYRNDRFTRGNGMGGTSGGNGDMYMNFAKKADVYLAFYTDMGAKQRTIAPSYINFNIIEENIIHKTSHRPYKLPIRNYYYAIVANNLKGIERLIGTFEHTSVDEKYRDWGMGYELNNSSCMQFLGKGRFYKGLPPLNLPPRIYLYEENYKQETRVHPYPPGAY